MANRVDHLSYSAIISFLRNQVEFHKRYVAGIWDNAKSPAAIVGTAFHKALEEYYKGADIQASVSAGLEEINFTSDYEIDYGKTGSREKMIKDYTTLVNKYFEEAPSYHKIIDIEVKLRESVAGVPMVAKIDMVDEDENGSAWLDDHKTVGAYSPEEEENYKYLLQGYIYLVVAEKHYGREFAGVRFGEIKRSINRDGSPQRREVVYDRESLLAFAPVAQKIITNVFAYVNDDHSKFFPNPSDTLSGVESMELVSNMEVGFDAARVKKQVKVADKFAPRHVTVDIDGSDGTPEELILRKFIEFGIGGISGETHIGASVIQYTFKPNRGIAMSAVAKRVDDIAAALQSKYVRIEAPIRGTDLVGIEVPNEDRRVVPFEDSKHLKPGTMEIPLGEDVFGEVHYGDITKMPHLLIAGQTGAGKSVLLNVILHALTKQLTPDELQLVLIDPKQVELSLYDGDPHLWNDIVTTPTDAAEVLHGLAEQMEDRYGRLRQAGVRTIDDYKGGNMPRILVVIDEFADLLMTDTGSDIKNIDYKEFAAFMNEALAMSPTGRITQKMLQVSLKGSMKSSAPSCETSIIRLAQKARAVGIHLVLATQRPSADVVTGLIKANIPTKIAFSVTTSMNSKIILDQTGAESLTGYGDMLYQDPRSKSLQRLQGLYI